MTSRIHTKLQTFMRFTHEIALLSTCKRAQCGCTVFTSDMGHVLSIGYNGPAAGLDNDSCSEQPKQCGCAHAEANALVKLNSQVRGDLIMHTTTAPCPYCAPLIVNSRAIRVVIYSRGYSDNIGLLIIKNAGLNVLCESEISQTSALDLKKILRG
jgi:deoxycytidylate deaminase